MKTIFLQKLSLRNFKGIKTKDISFAELETEIAGPNGSGKTTVFDAFTWLLFGKDSHDKKDFNIKTLLSNGKNVPKTDHGVAGLLVVDGSEITLRKVYREKWVKKHGEADTELKGHETEFYINDVPKKAGEYAAEISEILAESTFKLITNPKYFTSQNWKTQRDILFEMAGTISDAEIADGNLEFTMLLEKLSGKSMADYLKIVTQQKKKLVSDLDMIPTRIDEAERGKPETQNWAQISDAIIVKRAKIADIETSISNASAAVQNLHTANAKIQTEINGLKTKQSEIVFKANSEAMEGYNQKLQEAQTLNFTLQTAKREYANAQKSIENRNISISDIKSKLDVLRANWKDIDAETFIENSSALLCPIWKIACGDPKSLELNAEKKDAAKETFNTDKVARLQAINDKGALLTAELAKEEENQEDQKNDLVKISNEIAELEAKALLFLDNKKPDAVAPDTLPEWVAVQSEIDALTLTIQPTVTGDNSNLVEEKRNLTAEISDLEKSLNDKSIIEKQDLRVSELQTESKKISALISDLEKDEFAIQNFTRAKIEECESRINNRFSYVTFKLFNEQLNGGENETCEALINGVPYSDANTASQINAGIDIIRVLSTFYGVQAPIFIDHAESVTDLLPIETQIIRLVVDGSKKGLTVGNVRHAQLA